MRPEWLERLIRQHQGRQGSSIDVVDAPELPHGTLLTFRPSDHAPNQRNTIHCDEIPAQESIHCRVVGGQWEIVDLAVDRRIEIGILPANPGLGDVLIGPRSAGTVTLTRPASGQAGCFEVAPGSTATVRIVNGPLQSLGQGDTGRVVLCGGTLSGLIGRLELDQGTISNNNGGQASVTTTVAELVIGQRSVLTLPRAGGSLEITSIRGTGPDKSRLVMDLEPDQHAGPPPLTVRTVDDVTIESNWPLLASLVQARHVVFEGHPTIGFATNAIAGDLTFRRGQNPTQLSAGEGAILTDVTGEIGLANVAGAHIEGQSEAPYVVSFWGSGSAPANFDGAYLRGFKFPRGLEGRKLLGAMESAVLVEPSTADLPGWQYRLQRRGGWANWKTLATPSSEERYRTAFSHDAELMRQLQKLTRDTGASGEISTKVAWCAQRMRHITTRGRAERLALSIYRTLGYGERPMPSLITWLALAALFAALAVVKLPHPVMHLLPMRLLGGWLRHAVSPSFFGSGGSSVTVRGALERVVLAVPLVTGALALRRYVRNRD